MHNVKMRTQSVNRILLTGGFIMGNLLWIKALYDIATANKIWPKFSFPVFFIPLFILGAVASIVLSVFCLKQIWQHKDQLKLLSGKWTLFIWLAIPISVICTSPVCYRGTIFIAPYLTSAVIRLGLLFMPILAGLLYFKGKKEVSILILLISSFLLLIPNDKCYNPFNYWWIDNVGASPLTYLPTMLVILFGITGLYGKNKYLIITIVYGLSVAALFIAIGHRVRLLW